MNPRLFCREHSYQKALLLTYSFDPIFFEQVILPDLWAGRSSDILVLGGREQIAAATQAAIGQLWHLGKSYLLAGAKHTGSFHPKVILRLGANDGVIMLGSGNLTSSGWGGNQELGTAWMIGPEHADKGSWLHPFLNDVMSWCSGDLEKDAVRRMKDVPWLVRTPVSTEVLNPVLHSHHGYALAPLLSQRWAGRQFDEVKILTGSTDESGAFLRWAHSEFGIKRATVLLTPTMASFLPDKLSDLPFELRMIPAPAERPLHAKFYWFDGPTGPGAVMGSANCSAAAWLLPPNKRGNVETVLIYDAPIVKEFASMLEIFSIPSLSPIDLLSSRQTHTIENISTKHDYELINLRWDNVTHCLCAVIRPSPSADSNVELNFDGKQLPMTRTLTPNSYWECELPEGIGNSTAFASVHLKQGDKSWISHPRWIDDLNALQHACRNARLFGPFEPMGRPTSSAEQRQMLADLHEVAQALFNDSASFRDPGFGSSRKDKSDDEVPAVPVNPNDLISHLEGHQVSSQQYLSSSHLGSLSLAGLLRLLFDDEAEDGGAAIAAQDEQIDEGQIPDGANPPVTTSTSKKKSTKQDSITIEERFREQLAAQISTFLAEVSSEAFAHRCTATQMVQAITFPLAVALRGQKQGWVPVGLSEKWALKIFAILFRGKGLGTYGLLRKVEQRYEQNNQLSTFKEVVGDGALWMVLVAILAKSHWQGVGTNIDKAVALKEVFTAPQLVASAEPSRVANLLGRIRIEDARSYIAEIAPKATYLLNQINDILIPIWETELISQTEQFIIHKVGDLLWRKQNGWAVCLEESKTKSTQRIKVRFQGVETLLGAGYYVNVTDISGRNPELLTLIRNLYNCVSNPI